MNEAWVLEWAESLEGLEYCYSTYMSILDPEFFTEESPVEHAALWLSRDTLLEAMVDIVRDLYWHDLTNRPIGRQ